MALATVSNWRSNFAKRFPDDHRNERAASLLATLASEPISGLPANLLEEVGKHQRLTEATKTLASRIGFSLFPADLAEFLCSVLIQEKEVQGVFPKGDAR